MNGKPADSNTMIGQDTPDVMIRHRDNNETIRYYADDGAPDGDKYGVITHAYPDTTNKHTVTGYDIIDYGGIDHSMARHWVEQTLIDGIGQRTEIDRAEPHTWRFDDVQDDAWCVIELSTDPVDSGETTRKITTDRDAVIDAAQDAAISPKDPHVRVRDDGSTEIIQPDSIKAGDRIPVERFVADHHTDTHAIGLMDGEEKENAMEGWANAIELRDEIPTEESPTGEPIRVEYE